MIGSVGHLGSWGGSSAGDSANVFTLSAYQQGATIGQGGTQFVQGGPKVNAGEVASGIAAVLPAIFGLFKKKQPEIAASYPAPIAPLYPVTYQKKPDGLLLWGLGGVAGLLGIALLVVLLTRRRGRGR